MQKTRKFGPATWLCVLLLLVATGGCSMRVITADGTEMGVRSAEFSAYVERVFRAQNRVAGELGFALLDAELAGDDAAVASLEAAEAALLAACQALNELAVTHRDGDRMPRMQALAAARTAPGCEAVTGRVESMLDAGVGDPL
jgi:hypothetical protein